ncbi:WavE lipopolysaccharide synthesis family protein [Lachnospiraceae bacterium 62-35]
MIKSCDISVVIQGPIMKELLENGNFITQEVCKSIREHLPEAEIIISTWEGEHVEGLIYDKIIFSKNIKANRIIMPWSDIDKLNTVNHQIITSYEGLKLAERKYALKLRSDLKIYGTKFLEYFNKYSDIPKNKELLSWKIFYHRLITLPTYNINKKYGLPYNICDWFFFGLTKDLLYYFETPLVDTYSFFIKPGEKYPRVEDNFGAEQLLWLQCLRKTKNIEIANAIDKTVKTKTEFEISLANNFIPISAKQAQLINLKYGVAGYGVEPYLSHGFYTFEEWLRLYNKYGGGNIKIKNNYKEGFIYFLYQIKDSLYDNSKLFRKVYNQLIRRLKRHGT